jgi:ankyrin repeat protein
LVACVDALLRHGADADLCDERGFTPLELAVQNGLEKVVELLQAHKKSKSELPEYF